jgi:ketopantoate reductase
MNKIALSFVATLLLVVGVSAGITIVAIQQIQPGAKTGTFVLTSTNGVNSWSTPSASPNFSDSEVPGGTINGTNAVFTLANTPASGSTPLLFRNGIAQQNGSTGDYTISGATVTFNATSIPLTGDTLLAWYRH